MRRKRIGWLPIIVIVIVGLYLNKRTVVPTQAPPVATNNTRPEAVPAPHVPPHADYSLYFKIVGVHDGDTIQASPDFTALDRHSLALRATAR